MKLKHSARPSAPRTYVADLIAAVIGSNAKCERAAMQRLGDAGVDGDTLRAIRVMLRRPAPAFLSDVIVVVRPRTGDFGIVRSPTARTGCVLAELIRPPHRAYRRRGDRPTLAIMESGHAEQSAAFERIVCALDAEVDLLQSYEPDRGVVSIEELLAPRRTDGTRCIVAAVAPDGVERAAQRLRALGVDEDVLRVLLSPVEGHVFVAVAHAGHCSSAAWVEQSRVVDVLLSLWGPPVKRLAVLRDGRDVVVELGNESQNELMLLIIDGMLAGTEVTQ